jgi:hypothetical protein
MLNAGIQPGFRDDGRDLSECVYRPYEEREGQRKDRHTREFTDQSEEA